MTLYQRLLIFFTFITGIVLDVLPVPGWGLWVRPNWTFLIMLYWVMVIPYRVSVGTAFILGLILDLFNGSLLGENAVCFVLAAYIIARLHKKLFLFPIVQQMLILLLIVTMYKVIIFCVQGFIGHLPGSYLYWAAIPVSVILWPFLFILLNELQKAFRIGVL